MSSRRGLAERWEALGRGVQAGVSFSAGAVVLFLINLGPFAQPWWRSILYGLIEALPVTALVVIATANESNKRRGG